MARAPDLAPRSEWIERSFQGRWDGRRENIVRNGLHVSSGVPLSAGALILVAVGVVAKVGQRLGKGSVQLTSARRYSSVASSLSPDSKFALGEGQG
jgi:hypothetical protein